MVQCVRAKSHSSESCHRISAAQPLAKEDGVSLNQWIIAAAVAEKVGVVETAAEFFRKRAGQTTGAGLMKFLRRAPDVKPEPEDEKNGT